MKLSNIALAAALALTIAGPAAAAVSASDIAADVRSAYTGGNVQVIVDGNEVTLFGWVDDAQGKHAAEHAALSVDGIDSVKNRIITSN